MIKLLLLLSLPLHALPAHAQQTWTLEGPIFSIGGSEAPAPQSFGDVVGAVALSDGHTAVFDNYFGQVRFFDSTGRHLGSVGRKGSGPGEFGLIKWVGSCRPGEISIYDASHHRLTTVTAEMTLKEPVALPRFQTGRSFYRIRCAPGNRHFVASWAPTPREIEEGPYELPFMLGMLEGGVAVDTLGSVPGGERYMFLAGAGRATTGPRIMGSTTFLAGNDRIIVYGVSREPAVRIFRNGAWTICRLPFPPKEITEEDVRTYVNETVETIENPNHRRARRRVLEDMEFPNRYPFYSDIVAAKTGDLWVRAYPEPSQDSVTWLVLAPDCEPRATLTSPTDLRIAEVGSDFVLGISTDALGAEVVQRFEIDRGGIREDRAESTGG